MSEPKVTELRDEALMKIGRNLVSYQRFEKALKLMIVGSNVRGCASEFAKIYQEKVKDTDYKTMGLLVGELFKTVYSSDEPEDYDTTEISDDRMAVGFKIERDKDATQALKEEYAGLVQERNVLIHRLLADFDPDSEESCRQLIGTLDAQHSRLEPHNLSLMRTIGHIHVAQQELLKHLEAQLRESSKDGDDAVLTSA